MRECRMNPSSGHRRRASWLTLFCAAALAQGAHAAKEMVPEVNITAENNDNLLFTADSRRSASRGVLDAGVTFSGFSQTGNFFVQPRITADAYPDSQDKQFESTDSFLRAGGQHQWQTVDAGFRLNWAKESLLRSELASAVPIDPDAPPPVDVGTGQPQFFNAERTTFFNDANVDFHLSERDRLGFDFKRADVSYTTPQSVPFYSDFSNTGVTAQFGRQLNSRNRLSALLSVTRYDAKRNDNITDTVGLGGVFERRLSQTVSLTLTAGAQRSDYTFNSQTAPALLNSYDTNFMVDAGFRKRGERSLWNVDVRHGVQPNGNGYVLLRSDLRTYVSRQLTQRFSVQVGLLISKMTTLNEVNPLDDRDYGRLNLNFQWALKRTVFLNVGLDSVAQKFINRDTKSRSQNVVHVGIGYRGLSRQNR
jgi:hypothetical protein